MTAEPWPDAGQIARLRVEIDEVTPAVVRGVEVPLDIRLDDLHFVLQIAIGWQNGHPFEFRVEGMDEPKRWGLADRADPQSPLPAESATLAELLALGQRVFHYDFTFGEDWTHTVELEAIAPADRDTRYPRLVNAQNRCPPADIGGPMGYETYLRAIADPLHLNHESMREWEPDFDPHAVDEATIRANLAGLGKYLGRRKVQR
jgi:Plasmid pRiA4b ORF-3-like protein